MLTIGAFEAKTHFSKILTRVRDGEKVVITKNGEKVAIFEPFHGEKEIPIEKIFAKMDRLSKKIGKTGFSLQDIKTMKEKGRA